MSLFELSERCKKLQNVPGAFSTNKGNDFRAVLEEITETKIPMPKSGKWATAGMVRSGKCEVAWRVLDAQYWGVPQRRKRIFLVADFRTNGRCAGEILFVEEGLSRNTEQSGKERESITPTTEESTRESSEVELYENHGQDCRYKLCDKVSPTISATFGMGGNNQPFVVQKVYDMVRRHDVCRPQEDGTMPTVTASYGTGGNNIPIVVKSVVENQEGAVWCSDKCNSLTTGGGKPGQGYPCVCFEPGVTSRDGGHIYTDNKAPTLRANLGDNFPAIAVDIYNGKITSDKTCTITTQAAKSNGTSPKVMENMKTIRKLTVLECERLQGLPDHYTLIDDKTCSDSARYKAIGNGMAIPCANYVIQRIVECAGE